MKQGFIETVVGFAVILIAASFFYYAYSVSDSGKPNDGYLLTANFENIEGLTVGSDIKISGIKIGYIEKILLDNAAFVARVDLRINKGVEIPVDSRLSVTTSGLIGNKYLNINPGASNDNLNNGDRFKFTQSALNIEDLISKLVYAMTSNNTK